MSDVFVVIFRVVQKSCKACSKNILAEYFSNYMNMCTMVFVKTIRTIYIWKSTRTYACPNSNEPTLEPHKQFLYWTRTYKVMLNALSRYQIVHAEASMCHIKNVSITSDFLSHLRLNTDNWPHRFVLKIALYMSAKSVLLALWFSYM